MALTLDTTPEVAAAKVQWIDLQRITTSDDMQPRLVISEDAIRRYKDRLRQDRDAFPPVLLADLGAGTRPDPKNPWNQEAMLTVIDGWHRFRAHEETRMERIKARVIHCSPERAMWLAALANMHHGLPLKRGDQRRVFRRYITAAENRNPDGSPKSYRDIEADLGGLRGASTIHGWMQRDFPMLAAEMAKRGEVMEPEPWKEPRESHAQREIKKSTLNIVHVAKRAAKEDKEDITGDILWCCRYLTMSLGDTIGIAPERLFEAAKEAEWRACQDEGDEAL
jgi:hypothetical protein